MIERNVLNLTGRISSPAENLYNLKLARQVLPHFTSARLAADYEHLTITTGPVPEGVNSNHFMTIGAMRAFHKKRIEEHGVAPMDLTLLVEQEWGFSRSGLFHKQNDDDCRAMTIDWSAIAEDHVLDYLGGQEDDVLIFNFGTLDEGICRRYGMFNLKQRAAGENDWKCYMAEYDSYEVLQAGHGVRWKLYADLSDKNAVHKPIEIGLGSFAAQTLSATTAVKLIVDAHSGRVYQLNAKPGATDQVADLIGDVPPEFKITSETTLIIPL